MRCYDCNKVYELQSGALKIWSCVVGEFEIYDMSFYKCPKCKKILYPEKTVLAIEKEENKLKGLKGRE